MKCVYKITNVLNGKFYIGGTTRFEKRVQQWRDYTSNVNSAVKKDILRYGRDNFTIEPIEIFPEETSKQEIAAKELDFIHKLQPEYNTIGKPRTMETRGKLSKALAGRKMPPEVGKKISVGQKVRHKIFPQTNAGHLKKALIIETGEVVIGIKNVAVKLGVNASTVAKAIKRSGTVKGYHIKLLTECRD